MGFRKKAGQTAKGFQHQSHHKRRLGLSRRSVFMAFILSFIIFSCTHTSKSELFSVSESSHNSRVLKIWWDRGYTVEEDKALQQVVSNWEKQTGNKVKLSFYSGDELPHRVHRALRAGSPPDLMLSYAAHTKLNPGLAWEGKLADVSDVIEPIKSFYPESVLQAVSFYNKFIKKHRYYAVPIYQTTIHIFYWRDLLEQVGRSKSDIPKDWDGFWEFWKQVHNDLRSQHKQNIYGLGLLYSIGSGDTYYLFEQLLEAYDVQILDSEGKLKLSEPQVRQQIVNLLDWYTQFYQQGYVPPDAVKWLDPDNNRSLLNRVVVMTPNPTLTIPNAMRQDTYTYYHKLGTLKFPNKPNGQPMRYIVNVSQVVLFADSYHQKQAKDFLAYLIQPQVIGKYLKASGRGNLPVMEPVWKDPFWTDPKDPHFSTATETLIQSPTRPFDVVQHPAYSTVLKENLWAKALNRIVVDGISPQQAADEAIARIQQIFDQWQ
ncbi:ABC transporter substrate-binding protein [Nostocales cyanobacterium HT-58-2]|nr:ABC transporter substrate-binding protein [Nostocales cyanobacterium HT-58-2]